MTTKIFRNDPDPETQLNPDQIRIRNPEIKYLSSIFQPSITALQNKKKKLYLGRPGLGHAEVTSLQLNRHHLHLVPL
jgi:hypothetical protein